MTISVHAEKTEAVRNSHALTPFVLALCAGIFAAPAPAEEMTGEQYAQIYNWCYQQAVKSSPSPAWTRRGKAYVNAFVTQCLIRNGVQPVVVLPNG